MIRRFQFLVGLLILILTTSFNAYAEASNLYPAKVQHTMSINEGPVGVWDYEVEGTEDTYRTGVLFIRKENGAHLVEVHLGNGVLNGQDVQVQGNTIKFTLNLDGLERVSVVLNADNDVVLGQVTTDQGSYTIKGTRKLPPQ